MATNSNRLQSVVKLVSKPPVQPMTWCRIAAKTPTNVTERSPTFVLNWDFKPEPEPKNIIDDDYPPRTPQPQPEQSQRTTPSNYWDEWLVKVLSWGTSLRLNIVKNWGRDWLPKKPKKNAWRRLPKDSKKKEKVKMIGVNIFIFNL